MFEFIDFFFTKMTFFSCNALNATALKCVSMKDILDQRCQILTVMNLHFVLTVFLKINVVAVVTILLIHNDPLMTHFVSLMLFKTWILKYLIECQILMKKDMYLGVRLVHVNVD